MNLEITSRTALVLGAGGGLGRAIALVLASEGVKVSLADIEPTALQETADALAEVGARAHTLVWNLADLSVLDQNVTRIEHDLGPVDILVNNTGGPPPSTAAGVESATWLNQF